MRLSVLFVFRCAEPLRKLFVSFTFRIFEAVETADSILDAIGMMEGCTSLLDSNVLAMGTTQFGLCRCLHDCFSMYRCLSRNRLSARERRAPARSQLHQDQPRTTVAVVRGSAGTRLGRGG